MEKQIKVIVKHLVAKKGANAGNKFDAYRAVKSDGKLIDCRFRKEVRGIPVNNFIMTVDTADINVSHAREYPCLWVKSVIDFAPVQAAPTEDEELPF